MDHGDPPWRWYLMTDLTQSPRTIDGDAVWCESDSIFLVDDPSRLLGPLCPEERGERKASQQATRR